MTTEANRRQIVTITPLSRELAARIIKTVDAGLSSGLGKPKPGSMCVEAAVCFAMGLPHGDDPPCVGSAVRVFQIRLNDSDWSSSKARAKGMRRLVIAQLGSDVLDQKLFSERMAIGTVRRILPIALRAAVGLDPGRAEQFERAAVACELVTTLEQALEQASLAQGVTDSAASSSASYAADAAKYVASSVASSAASSASAAYAAAYAAAYSASAYAASAASSASAASAAASLDGDAASRDQILTVAADLAVEVLQSLGSQGCQWLDLCD